MSITRRVFLKNGALALVATTAIPSFLTRTVWGTETTGTRRKRLVVLFQRGAADGLNIVVPHGESAYYSMRPSIAIPRPNRGQECRDRPGWLLRTAPVDGIVQAAVGPEAPGHRARRRLAGQHALPLRRAGLHGIWHAGREVHRRWLAQPCGAPARARREPVPRHLHGGHAAAGAGGHGAGGRHRQHQ